MATWEQDFDFYMANIEDKPASFVIDLNAAGQAPLASHPLRLSIRVPMLRPRADGLRDASELDELGALEDQFVETLAEKVDAVYVGRVVHDGNTTMYLYVPAEHRDALEDLPALTGAPPGDHEPLWGVVDDPTWDVYTEFLYPDEYAHQTIWNRRLLRVFGEKGDQLDVAREIDHVAFFATREAAEQAAAALAAAGFRVDEVTTPGEEDEGDEADGGEGEGEADVDEAMGSDEEDEEADGGEGEGEGGDDGDGDDDDDGESEGGGDDDGDSDDDDGDSDSDEGDDDEERWALEFHRDDALADGRPDEFVAEILDIILPLGGRYDGWGAEHRPAATD